MFTGGRATGKSQDCWSRVRGEGEAAILSSLPFLISNWSGAASHQGPVHRVPPGARGRGKECALLLIRESLGAE